VGRSSLRFTLESVREQPPCPTVEVVVVADGPSDAARTIFDRVAAPCWQYLEHGPTRVQGNAQRMAGMKAARGRHLMFLDDDDVYVPHALERVLAAIGAHPGRILFFRLDRFGELSWRRQELRQGTIGAGNVVVPNVEGRLGSWTEPESTYVSDYQFIEQSVRLQGDPVWIDEVITICDQPYWLPWRRKRSNVVTRRLDRVRSGARLRTRARRIRSKLAGR
jgi:glycosyltransferase involved in cell wall biosynthesis